MAGSPVRTLNAQRLLARRDRPRDTCVPQPHPLHPVRQGCMSHELQLPCKARRMGNRRGLQGTSFEATPCAADCEAPAIGWSGGSRESRRTTRNKGDKKQPREEGARNEKERKSEREERWRVRAQEDEGAGANPSPRTPAQPRHPWMGVRQMVLGRLPHHDATRDLVMTVTVGERPPSAPK